MNFLAHLYLSGNNKDIRLGNFIADAVKGKSFTGYPEFVQKGILLHRNIDSFTDEHALVRQGKNRLSGIYGKHGGIVIDIFYDHFLATGWKDYSSIPFSQFIKESYILLVTNYPILPLSVKQKLPFMIINNWLKSYLTLPGLRSILGRMSSYTSLPDATDKAMVNLEANYHSYQEEFTAFFSQITRHVSEKYNIELPAPGGK